MRAPRSFTHPLAATLLLAGLVLCSRLALATHPYGHDLAAFDGDCEVCEAAQVRADGPHAAEPPSGGATAESVRLHPVSAPDLRHRWPRYVPRGPPCHLL